MDFSFSSPRSAIKGCTQTSFPGVGAAQVLTPGDPGQSAVYLRMATRTDYKMPPLATNEVDDVASAVMADWIRTLKTCE